VQEDISYGEYKQIQGSKLSPMCITSHSAAMDIATDPQAQYTKQLEWKLLSMNPKDSSTPIEGILIKSKKDNNAPLIVMPHGGPHAVSATTYSPSVASLASQGYSILLPNYRGSIGFGQDGVEALPGNCGTMDVADCVALTTLVISLGLADGNRVGVCGGSHGGFLGAHLIGQHPKLFKVAALRNPVTNIAAMTTATDIVDWCWTEAGYGGYDPSKFAPPTSEVLSRMMEMSPARYASEVKAPLLMCLGKSDKRVPFSQGVEFYHAVKSNGTACKMLMYKDDVHAIDKVKSVSKSE
jgi:acylaminoacyl-peptidase